MKLLDYIHYLQHLYDKHGDDDFDYSVGYTKAIRPYYMKKKNCVVVYEDSVSFDYGVDI